VPRLCEEYPGICLKTEGKARKNLSQGSRRVPVGMMKREYREQSTYNNKNTRGGGPKNNRNLNVAREVEVAEHRATASSSRATFKFRLFLGPSSYINITITIITHNITLNVLLNKKDPSEISPASDQI
jgi:hypothetical protein